MAISGKKIFCDFEGLDRMSGGFLKEADFEYVLDDFKVYGENDEEEWVGEGVELVVDDPACGDSETGSPSGGGVEDLLGGVNVFLSVRDMICCQLSGRGFP